GSQIGIAMLRSNPPPPFTSLVQMDGAWDWNESGMDLGAAWRGTNYVEDFNWGTGNGVFYFDSSGFRGACAGAPGAEVSVGLLTYYFRTTFVPPPGSLSSGILRLRHIIDDGAVFYLNGTEILRFGFGTNV